MAEPHDELDALIDLLIQIARRILTETDAAEAAERPQAA